MERYKIAAMKIVGDEVRMPEMVEVQAAPGYAEGRYVLDVARIAGGTQQIPGTYVTALLHKTDREASYKVERVDYYDGWKTDGGFKTYFKNLYKPRRGETLEPLQALAAALLKLGDYVI